MKYIEELHDRDIAAALFISSESVRQLLSRARKSLVAAFGRCSE
jgi:DNA-directed RNA polymerase specialized sigma24 family protein